MDRNGIITSVIQYTQESPGNYISGETAILPEYAGMKIFDTPIFAFGSTDDEVYQRYLSTDVIGNHFLPPLEWLPGAKTVISCFLPYTDRIKQANAADYYWPAGEWLHGRYEGQLFVRDLTGHILKTLEGAGYKSIAPMLDTRFKIGNSMTKYTSNWSERHAAYACGLGTFGLSKGIITEKGMCGRLCSVITVLDLPKNNRPYHDVYEYCSMCGACVKHCPAQAISIKDGKRHPPCDAFLDEVLVKEKPRYGCGKCQVRVPCESGIPKSKAITAG